MSPNGKVELVQLSTILPCPENDGIYAAPSLDDPDIIALIESIRKNGILEPIQVSADGVIISGHRRRFCALHAGLREVPIVRNTVSYRNDREAFMQYLIDANSQRKKSTGMLLREAAMRIDPREAVQAMRTERKERDEELLDRSEDTIMEAGGNAKRKKISDGSMPFLEAARKVANENRDYWPLSVRQIHYRLLNDPPLKFTPKGGTSKKDRRYANDEASYKALVNLLARARVEGSFPWAAIDDETRPEALHDHYWNPGLSREAAIVQALYLEPPSTLPHSDN
jgi:ParB-like nuclease domain